MGLLRKGIINILSLPTTQSKQGLVFIFLFNDNFLCFKGSMQPYPSPAEQPSPEIRKASLRQGKGIKHRLREGSG